MISDPGKTLQDFRKLHGLKQKDLAAFMHVHPITISTWETGASKISIDNYIKMFDYMGYEIVIRKKKKEWKDIKPPVEYLKKPEDNHGIEENTHSH